MDQPDPAVLDDLAGLAVEDATMRAVAAGWRVRSLRPGDMMTLDYRPDRVNLFLDEDGADTVARTSVG
jgi:hypothetical protein